MEQPRSIVLPLTHESSGAGLPRTPPSASLQNQIDSARRRSVASLRQAARMHGLTDEARKLKAQEHGNCTLDQADLKDGTARKLKRLVREMARLELRDPCGSPGLPSPNAFSFSSASQRNDVPSTSMGARRSNGAPPAGRSSQGASIRAGSLPEQLARSHSYRAAQKGADSSSGDSNESEGPLAVGAASTSPWAALTFEQQGTRGAGLMASDPALGHGPANNARYMSSGLVHAVSLHRAPGPESRLARSVEVLPPSAIVTPLSPGGLGLDPVVLAVRAHAHTKGMRASEPFRTKQAPVEVAERGACALCRHMT